MRYSGNGIGHSPSFRAVLADLRGDMNQAFGRDASSGAGISGESDDEQELYAVNPEINEAEGDDGYDREVENDEEPDSECESDNSEDEGDESEGWVSDED